MIATVVTHLSVSILNGVGKSDNVVIDTQVTQQTNLDVQVFLNSSLLNHDFGSDDIKTIIFTEKNTATGGQKQDTSHSTSEIKQKPQLQASLATH